MLYSYDRTELEARVESVDESAMYWSKKRITFKAAYGGERMAAYLFVPKEARSPYQPVVYFPTTNALRNHSSEEDLQDLSVFGFIIQSGRAVIYPVYKGTYERRFQQGAPGSATEPIAHRNWFVQSY